MLALLIATALARPGRFAKVSTTNNRGIRSDTYESEAFPLHPGEFLYTDMDSTTIEMPDYGGRYAITGFSGDIVFADTKEPVALSQVYDHHWIVAPRGFRQRLCDGPDYVFGVGAESRRTPVRMPDGYGFVADNADTWGANIHLLRTEYLEGDAARAAKECNECYYAPGKGCFPAQNGTFNCCGDTGRHVDPYNRCPVAADAPNASVSYQLRYTVNTTAVDDVMPAMVGVLTTPDCNTYYAVEENNDEPEQVSSTEFRVPTDAQVLTAIGHQHVGALNISMFLNGEFVCASYPKYGSTFGAPGDELGYLVEMSYCFDKDDADQPLLIRRGDTLRLDSWYFVGSDDPRIAPLPGGTHLNVMGYMYVVYGPSDIDD